ncbi:hypothetical protein NDU88_010308 [Pleurodeles waltl]|uniref:Uncharacterized protein n=1 Tax=Pleurodeles waltl TaxID=8319 RepID=A0AAV7S2X8_PLEWA|nr:hypothetical protein NDU88_010308 [Pleurodeles waltl]
MGGVDLATPAITAGQYLKGYRLKLPLPFNNWHPTWGPSATRGSNGRGPDDRVNDCNDREELLPDRPSSGSRSSELHWFRADLSRVIYGPDWEPSGVPRQIRRVEDDRALEAEDEKLSMRSG